MCGFYGELNIRQLSSKDSFLNGLGRLSHRGPDELGYWTNERTVQLGHARLAIQDLTANGQQPMTSRDQRYTIVFNGEIYNFQAVQRDLRDAGVGFRGHSDTEVLVEAISFWGLPAVFGKLVGMFAFGVWDRQDQTLVLARDRIGEKPLYYGRLGSSFVFASELKAFRAHSGWRGEIDRNSLTSYLRFGYVPNPYSIFKGIRKLPPATYLTVSLKQAAEEPLPKTYWRFPSSADTFIPASCSESQAMGELNEMLSQSVKEQLIADVPLGGFLSGGIDSSLIIAMAQTQSTSPIKTFSLGFTEPEYDEAPAARAIANFLHTHHTECYVSPDDALKVIPLLPKIYDEPFADSSQIPAFLVSKLARKDVKVCLTGDGGDELFAGYRRYTRLPRLLFLLGAIPGSCRRWLGSILKAVTSRQTTCLLDRTCRLSETLLNFRPAILQRAINSMWPFPERLVLEGHEPQTLFDLELAGSSHDSMLNRSLVLDCQTYLTDDLLVKVDRASMAVSLETRAPLLDYRIIEFANRLPDSYKIRNGTGKWILRQLLGKYLPESLIASNKKGFAIPLAAWLRGPLKTWATDLLAPSRLKSQGLLHPELINLCWRQHITSNRDYSPLLWTVLMFQAWMDENIQ